MKKNIRILPFLCLCICLFSHAAFALSTADANEPLLTGTDCSLTLHYVHDGTAFPDLPVQLYCVATISSDMQYTLTDTFCSTKLTVNGIQSTGEWDAVRTTLESFIVSNHIAPEWSARTDSAGTVKMDSLTPGLYFVMPTQAAGADVYYSFRSALIAVPNLDKNGYWVYDVTATPKASTNTPTEEQKEYQVVKLWRDDGDGETRPAGITVDIFCNGNIVESVILSSENQWSYAWTAADNGDVWHVAEQNVPEGYIMTVEEHATSFTIINTIPTSPPSPSTGDFSNIGIYIMLMCISGIVLIMLGTVSKRKADS